MSVALGPGEMLVVEALRVLMMALPLWAVTPAALSPPPAPRQSTASASGRRSHLPPESPPILAATPW
jgi:hypothetical protein